jgi:REP element-mobilizing transposase RayT
MPRSLRIERANGVYHIINRGNYRQDLFINEGAHLAFEKCLFEACEKCGWVLEGFCVMTNHFHLVVRTPRGNLIYGMKWLQSTFANRYHKFRQVHGKLFQGRYKSLIVEEDSHLGALLHYVHLNPVRAGIVSVDALNSYRWSSYWYLNHKKHQPPSLDVSGALEAAGGLRDTAAGIRKYGAYLKWLATDDAAQKEMAFEKMCQGWALGSKEFKKSILDDELSQKPLVDPKFEGRDLSEVNELLWERLLEQCLEALSKTEQDIDADPKSAEWKVSIATILKKRTSAPNTWISQHLRMGVPQAVSRYSSALLAKPKRERKLLAKLTAIITE